MVNFFFCVLWRQICIAAQEPNAPPIAARVSRVASGTLHCFFMALCLSTAYTRNATTLIARYYMITATCHSSRFCISSPFFVSSLYYRLYSVFFCRTPPAIDEVPIQHMDTSRIDGNKPIPILEFSSCGTSRLHLLIEVDSKPLFYGTYLLWTTQTAQEKPHIEE